MEKVDGAASGLSAFCFLAFFLGVIEQFIRHIYSLPYPHFQGMIGKMPYPVIGLTGAIGLRGLFGSGLALGKDADSYFFRSLP